MPPVFHNYSPEPNTGCWLWLGALSTEGYGTIGHRYMHRMFYEWRRGPIPQGLTIDHLCHCRSCVNPDHMEPVTRGENVRRGKARIRECPTGHAYEFGNTCWTPRGHRYCAQCNRDRANARTALGLRKKALRGEDVTACKLP